MSYGSRSRPPNLLMLSSPMSTSDPIGNDDDDQHHCHGIDWQLHCVDPIKTESLIQDSTMTIPPWQFPWPEVGSTINHGGHF